VPDGLLYVLSEPGAVDEAEFHDWYDNEHAPLRTALPGVLGGHRYRAADDRKPTWMALYDLPLDLLSTPAYTRLRDERSEREARIFDQLEALERGIYRLVSTTDELAMTHPAPFMIAVSFDPGDYGDERLDAWYDEEHTALLQKVPGWRSTRRYRLVDGPGLPHLALHEWDSPVFVDTEEYRFARSTPWRDEVFASIRGHDRREFTHYRTVSAPK
jgi:hypothetical protein